MLPFQKFTNDTLELLPEFESIFHNEFDGLYPELEFEVMNETDLRSTVPYIKWVQESLNKILGLRLVVDGDSGTNTIKAIKRFQTENGLGSYGTVGPKTEALLVKAGATPPPGTHIPIAPQPSVITCTNQVDVTTKFRKFLVDAPNIVASSVKIPAAIKPRIIQMIKEIIQIENQVDINTYTVFSCSNIGNPLMSALGILIMAQIDPANKIIWLSDAVWQCEGFFRTTEDLDDLADFFATIGHEKRHATLGSTIQVNQSVVNPGLSISSATAVSNTQYRTEEILANAEEILIKKRILSTYRVSTKDQQTIRRHWIDINNNVNPNEVARLKTLIIQELRKRYGFTNNCDNALTVAMVMCMETARMQVCFSGKIYQPIPSGLNLCKNSNGNYQICP